MSATCRYFALILCYNFAARPSQSTILLFLALMHHAAQDQRYIQHRFKLCAPLYFGLTI